MSATDNELLELAAKAAGIAVEYDDVDCSSESSKPEAIRTHADDGTRLQMTVTRFGWR